MQRQPARIHIRVRCQCQVTEAVRPVCGWAAVECGYAQRSLIIAWKHVLSIEVTLYAAYGTRARDVESVRRGGLYAVDEAQLIQLLCPLAGATTGAGGFDAVALM